MLTTNKVKLKDGEPKKIKFMTTSNVKPRKPKEPDLAQVSMGVNVREPKKIMGGMLTTYNYKQRPKALEAQALKVSTPKRGRKKK